MSRGSKATTPLRAGAAAWVIESRDARIVVDPAFAADEPDLIFRAFGAKAEVNADPKSERDRYEPTPEPTLRPL